MPLEYTDDEHKHILELARTMETNWHAFKRTHGADERAWKNLNKTELEEMHAQLSEWMQECLDELKVRKSAPGKDNAADEWLHSLSFKNKTIEDLIDNSA